MASVIFENVMLFDGVRPERTGPVHVRVEGNRIVDISEQSLAAEVERVDGRGRTLMPGLIDAHIHIYTESLHIGFPEPPITYRAQYAQLFLSHILACGFTSVRDVAGGDHGMAMALRAAFLTGPRFFYGGLCLTQTGGHGDLRSPDQPTDFHSCGAEHNFLAIHADGVDACIKAAREELRKGASHIKIMGSGGVLSPSDPIDRCQYSEAEIRAIVEECDRRGAYVCAHCHPAEAIRRCVEYGVRTIEHGTLINSETAAFVANRGAFVVPTLSVLSAILNDPNIRTLSEASLEKLRRVSEHALEGLRIMKEAGVKIGFGTDLIGEQRLRRDDEFRLRSKVQSPFEILNSATAVNAAILQKEGELGVVQKGALADLLLVEGNPLDCLDLLYENGAYITHIMVDGAFVKRPA